MAYTKIASVSSGVRGTHYSPGLNHVYFLKNNNSTSIGAGHLCRIRITPLETISEGSKSIFAMQEVNFDAGLNDIKWTGIEIKRPNNTVTKLYKYAAAPAHGLANIEPSSLPALPYALTSVLENGQGDNYYAAKTSASNYAVFRIFKAQDNPTVTKIEWITYKMSLTVDIIGSGYSNPRDIVMSDDLALAYVSATDEYGQDRVLAVPMVEVTASPSYSIWGNKASAYAIDAPAKPLVGTAQIALDPNHSQIIYVVDATGLWRIAPEQETIQVVAIPNGGMGLLIDNNGLAIISDRQGNLFEVDLAAAAPTLAPLPAAIATLGGPSGFLTWFDETKTSFLATVRAPANQVRIIHRLAIESHVFLNLQSLSAPLMNSWSVEAISPTRIFVATEGEVGTFDPAIASNALVLGIGFVPIDYIIQDPTSPHRGRADTTSNSEYFYQVNKVPFGGSLSLMIHHSKAFAAGIRHFRVTLKKLGATTGTVITHPCYDLLWKGTGGIPKFHVTPILSTGSTPVAPVPPNAYPIRMPGDFWHNTHLGMVLPTKSTDNGLHEIQFEFFDQNGMRVHAETKTYVVLLDNNKCNATLRLPRIGNPPPGTYPPLDCGCITYNSKNDHVELDFAAWQVNGEGTYTLTFFRDGKGLAGLTHTGPTSIANELQTKSTTSMPQSPTFKVGHLTGNCAIVRIVVDLNVPPRVIDGYRWVSSSCAYSRINVMLVPSSVPMSSMWVDPGG